MKLIKLKKRERDMMINQILDHVVTGASFLDISTELKRYLKYGLPSGIIPYIEKSDEALLADFLRSFSLIHLLDGDQEDEHLLRTFVNDFSTTKTRTDKIIKYLKQK